MAYVRHDFTPNEVLTSGLMNNLNDGIDEKLSINEYEAGRSRGYELIVDETLTAATNTKTWSLENSYYLTTSRPSDWTTSYMYYFTKNNIGQYVPVPEATTGTDIPTWVANTYYGSMSNYIGAIVSVQIPADSTKTTTASAFITAGINSPTPRTINFFVDRITHSPSVQEIDTYVKFENDHGFWDVQGTQWVNTAITGGREPLYTIRHPTFSNAEISFVRCEIYHGSSAYQYTEFPVGTNFKIRGLKR